MVAHRMLAIVLGLVTLLPASDAGSLRRLMKQKGKEAEDIMDETLQVGSEIFEDLVRRGEELEYVFITPPVSISPPPSPFGEPSPQPTSWGLGYLYTFIFWAIFVVSCVLVYFLCYKNCVSQPEASEGVTPRLEDLQKEFTSGHWHCFEDGEVCFCSFICMPLRWSDTQNLAKMIGFWTAFALFAVMLLLNNALAAGPFFTAGLIVYYRQQLRKKLKLENDNVRTCCVDFCYAFWCPCCAVAQEAHIVKEGIQSGYTFED